MRVEDGPSLHSATVARRLFLCFTLFFSLSTGGHVFSPDGLVMARVTESLVERGRLSVEDPGYPSGFLTVGPDDLKYAKYGVGFSVVAIPGYLVGKLLEKVMPERNLAAFSGLTFLWYDAGDRSTSWRFFGAGLTNAVVVSGCCSLLFLLALEMGYSRSLGLVLAGLLAVATPYWVYSKTFFSEPLTGLCLLLFVLCTLRWRRGQRSWDAWLAGFAVGCLVLIKTAHVVLWPLAAAVVASVLWTTEPRGVNRLRSVVSFATGPLVAGVLLGALNAARFGSPWETGYGSEATLWTTPWLEGTLGLLVSPGRGLLIFMPLVVLSFVAAPMSFRRSPLVTSFVLGATLVLVGLYSRWHGWDGGWAWGPRFLVPVMPLLLVVAAPSFQRVGFFASRLARILAGILIASSTILSAVGTLVPSTEYHHALRQMIGAGYLPAARWNWEVWPPVGYWHLPKSYWLVWTSWTTPGTRELSLGFLALLIVLLALLVRWRPWLQGRPVASEVAKER